MRGKFNPPTCPGYPVAKLIVISQIICQYLQSADRRNSRPPAGHGCAKSEGEPFQPLGNDDIRHHLDGEAESLDRSSGTVNS